MYGWAIIEYCIDDEYRQAAEAMTSITDDFESALEYGFNQLSELDDPHFRSTNAELNRRKTMRTSLLHSPLNELSTHFPNFCDQDSKATDDYQFSAFGAEPEESTPHELFGPDDELQDLQQSDDLDDYHDEYASLYFLIFYVYIMNIFIVPRCVSKRSIQ
jgi:hypothetical protein